MNKYHHRVKENHVMLLKFVLSIGVVLMEGLADHILVKMDVHLVKHFKYVFSSKKYSK